MSSAPQIAEKQMEVSDSFASAVQPRQHTAEAPLKKLLATLSKQSATFQQELNAVDMRGVGPATHALGPIDQGLIKNKWYAAIASEDPKKAASCERELQFAIALHQFATGGALQREDVAALLDPDSAKHYAHWCLSRLVERKAFNHDRVHNVKARNGDHTYHSQTYGPLTPEEFIEEGLGTVRQQSTALFTGIQETLGEIRATLERAPTDMRDQLISNALASHSAARSR